MNEKNLKSIVEDINSRLSKKYNLSDGNWPCNKLWSRDYRVANIGDRHDLFVLGVVRGLSGVVECSQLTKLTPVTGTIIDNYVRLEMGATI